MKDFIFHSSLKLELEQIISAGAVHTPVLCFWGAWGVGKSSFASYLSKTLASETIAYDCTVRSQSNILKDIEDRCRSTSLFCLDNDDDKQFQRCFILDEFQSLTTTTKNSFKLPLERLTASEKVLFIIICNATTKSLSEVLTRAIRSRCHCINFDVPKTEINEVVELVLERYPNLKSDYVKQTLPDFRQIVRAGKISGLINPISLNA